MAAPLPTSVAWLPRRSPPPPAPNQIATLILPADARGRRAPALPPDRFRRPGGRGRPRRRRLSPVLQRRARGPRRRPVTREAGQASPPVSRIGNHTGSEVLCECFPTRLSGAACPFLERLGYLGEFVQMQLDGIRHLVRRRTPTPRLVLRLPGQGQKPGARRLRGPRAGWPGRRRHRRPRSPRRGGGRRPTPATIQELARPERPTGPSTPRTLGAAIAAPPPRGGDPVDRSASRALDQPGHGRLWPPHPAHLTGGAIGYGLRPPPARLACPDRPVVLLEADGSGCTPQALWTQARRTSTSPRSSTTTTPTTSLNLELPGGRRRARSQGQGDVRPARPRPRLRELAAGHGRAGQPTHHRRGVLRRLRARPRRASPCLIEVGLTSRF